MILFPRPAAKLLPLAIAALLAGCAAHDAPMAVAVPYNPPSAALAASTTDWHHVRFASNSAVIGQDGQRTIDDVAGLLLGNPALRATVVGKTDAVGGDAANLRLSRHRATAVRDALLRTGKVTARRIETRWTGQRQPDEAAPIDVATAGNRMVDIGIH